MDRTSTLSWVFGLVLVVALSFHAVGAASVDPPPVVHTQVFTLQINNTSPYELLAPDELPAPRPQLTWSVSTEKAAPGQSMVLTAVLNRTGDQPGLRLSATLPFRTVVVRPRGAVLCCCVVLCAVSCRVVLCCVVWCEWKDW
jgi:hypothetical protein